MLEVRYSLDAEALKPLYITLGFSGEAEGINAVLYENGQAIGLCQMRLHDEIEIEQFKILPSYSDEERNDFFFRVILFKMCKTELYVSVKVVDSRLIKFGFYEESGKMKVWARDIKFPSKCSH
ncbi:MAG: hypothetical protein RR033_06275 [Clostridia bacterium]